MMCLSVANATKQFGMTYKNNNLFVDQTNARTYEASSIVRALFVNVGY